MSDTEADYEAFLAGRRPEDVLLYLREDVVSDPESLSAVSVTVDDGIVLVLPGEKGRSAFQSAVGVDPMGFAREAMDRDGTVERDCTGGDCPDGEDDGSHEARFVFAFAEAENQDAGGLYAEGPVIHGYVACECGTTYSERWVAES
ncbi:MAG: DUF5807 family protein [Natronomonas sp.]